MKKNQCYQLLHKSSSSTEKNDPKTNAKTDDEGRISLLFIVFLASVFFFGVLIYCEALKVREYVNSSMIIIDIERFSSDKLNKVVSCYYNTPNVQKNTSQLMPTNINPHLCTHINVAFAQVVNKTIYLDKYQQKAIAELLKLKKLNTKLKILLSIGGAGNDDGFSHMIINHASRKTFIKSIKYTLKNCSLDGIDLDWEFPGVEDAKRFYKNRQRQHFSQLLREIRMEYIREKKKYLLTIAVAAPKIIVDAAYDVDQINLYVDYVNLMTYDYHYYSKFTPFTGLNSPIYPRLSEQLYMATLNVNYTVDLYLNKGLDASKIVLGIPTYGHTFTLVNGQNTKIGSPASGYGELGSWGFVDYTDICAFVLKYNISITLDDDARVPYIYKDLEWVSFDSLESVVEKAKYIKEKKLRGAMIYSLNADDYDGRCKNLHGMDRFPLTESIKKTLDCL